MFRNYLMSAFRNLRKNKSTSAINIFGLTIGLTCCLLIALYIQHELSYDHFETKGDRIARVIMEYNFDGSSEPGKGNFTSVRVAAVFPRTFPDVESAVKMVEYSRVVHYGDKLIDEPHFMYADSNFFNIFSFNLKEGDQGTALTKPYSVVLTEDIARKYFPGVQALGKILTMGDTLQFIVTGVMENVPTQSHMQFE